MNEQLTPLYDKHCTCPACKHKYTTKKIRSSFLRTTKHDTDFCSYYTPEDLNPLLYYVNVCPECGFAESEEFSNYFPPTTVEEFFRKVSVVWKKKSYDDIRVFEDAIETYNLAIEAAKIKRESHIARSGLYIRVAWLYRTYDMSDKEQEFLKLALEQYSESFSKGDYSHTHMSDVRMMYLIGELNYRVGEEGKAIRFFSRVIYAKTIEKHTVEMARDRWQIIREEQHMREKQNKPVEEPKKEKSGWFRKLME